MDRYSKGGRCSRGIGPWILWLVIAALAAPAGATEIAMAPGDPAPEIVGWNLDGELETVAWKGITLVNFWTTWCQPCRREMPALQEAQDRLGADGLRVIGVTRETVELETVKTHLADVGVTYTILKLDGLHEKEWLHVGVVPTSFLINADGKLMRKYIGAQPEQVEGMLRDLEDAVAGRPLKPMVFAKPQPITDDGGR